MTLSRSLLYLVVCTATAAALAQARAAPLDDDTCARVKREHEELVTAGVDSALAKGPAWAKANLAPEKLALVRRFIELEELRLFRCRDKSLVTLPTEHEAAAIRERIQRDEAKQGRDAAAGTPAARSKTATAPAAGTPPTRTAAGPASEWGEITVTRSPPKTKAGDGYRPPPFDPAAIAEQLGLPVE